MKRILLWALSTISAVVLLFGYHTSTSSSLTTSTPTSLVSGTAAGSGAGGSQRSSGSSGGSGSSGSSTVTGTAVSTQWGPVQVQLSLDGGTITDVAVVEYPSNNPRDVEINDYALPVLVQETIDAQSADIDMVSGATVTSVGYQQSLQSALDQAGL